MIINLLHRSECACTMNIDNNVSMACEYTVWSWRWESVAWIGVLQKVQKFQGILHRLESGHPGCFANGSRVIYNGSWVNFYCGTWIRGSDSLPALAHR